MASGGGGVKLIGLGAFGGAAGAINCAAPCAPAAAAAPLAPAVAPDLSKPDKSKPP